MELRPGMMVDPPSGWRYGFPKIFDPLDGETLQQWLRRQGLPEALIELGSVRYWEEEKR